MSLLIHNDIKNIVRDIMDAYGLSECTVGTVISDDPLSVEISVTEEVFSEKFLIVPEHLTDHNIDLEYVGHVVSVGPPEVLDPTKEEHVRKQLTIYNGLKKGDSVILLKCFENQKLLILDRLPKQT